MPDRLLSNSFFQERAIRSGKVTGKKTLVCLLFTCCCTANNCCILLVNGVVATMDTVVKDNELVTHRVHRHEPPVTAAPLNIIHQDEDLVVLDKPASIPVSV